MQTGDYVYIIDYCHYSLKKLKIVEVQKEKEMMLMEDYEGQLYYRYLHRVFKTRKEAYNYLKSDLNSQIKEALKVLNELMSIIEIVKAKEELYNNL